MPECSSQFKIKCILNRMLPVHVVAQEEVVGLWWEAPVFEQSEQVVILTVDIACKQNCSILHSFSEVHGSNNPRLLQLFNCIKRKWGICVSRSRYIFVGSRNLGEIHWWRLKTFLWTPTPGNIFIVTKIISIVTNKSPRSLTIQLLLRPTSSH